MQGGSRYVEGVQGIPIFENKKFLLFKPSCFSCSCCLLFYMFISVWLFVLFRMSSLLLFHLLFFFCTRTMFLVRVFRFPTFQMPIFSKLICLIRMFSYFIIGSEGPFLVDFLKVPRMSKQVLQ